MRMQPCPHCGAQNSVKRTTCYQCQGALQPAVAEPASNADDRRPTPASRWEAIETGRPPRPRPLAGDRTAASTPSQTAPLSVPTLRRYLPAPRRALAHVRRMGVFFRELHALSRAGISIAPACRELERRAPVKLRRMASDMARAAEAGQPISSAMEAHATLLYPWHLGVIRAAEAGGFLPDAFEQIARAYETEWETRSALRLRLFFYVGLGLPAALLAAPVFLTIAQPIPRDGWTPDLLIATMVRFLKTVSLPIAAGLAVSVLVWQVLQSTAWFQAVQQHLVIRLPVVGGLAKAAALDRYLATLGLMLRGGLPVAQAAEEAAMAAGNAAVSQRLRSLVPALREGQSLSSLLSATRMFDPDTLQLAATGEVSGALPDMLARAAAYYQQESEGKRRMLLRLAQVLFGVIWLALMGGLFLLGVRLYFAFVFATYEWMLEGFE